MRVASAPPSGLEQLRPFRPRALPLRFAPASDKHQRRDFQSRGTTMAESPGCIIIYNNTFVCS